MTTPTTAKRPGVSLERAAPRIPAGAQPDARAPHYRPRGAFRLFLAAIVVVGHSQFLLGHEIQLLRRIDAGSLAVFGFFVLSGFVIAEANDTFCRGRTGSFFVNRALRILPPYYAALALSLLGHLALSATSGVRTYDAVQPTGLYSAANLTGNFLVMVVWNGLNRIGLSPDYYFVRYIWAVIVELKFYFVAGVLYFVWHRSPERWRGGLVALALIGLLALHVAGLLSTRGVLTEFQIVPLFIVGVALYHLLVGGTRWWLPAFLASLVLSQATVLRYVAKAVPDHSAVGAVAAFMGLCPVVTLLALKRVDPRAAALDRTLGDVTYPLYLNHYLVVVVFASLWPASGWIGMAACVTTAVLLSVGVSRLTDPPMKQLRDAVRGRRL